MAGDSRLPRLCLSLIFISILLNVISAQQNIGGVTYTIFSDADEADWETAKSACKTEGGDLAVIDNRETYEELVDWLTTLADNTEFHIGFYKDSGDSNLRTVGGRIANFSNVWASGASYDVKACVQLNLIGTGLGDDFMYKSQWELDDCADTEPYICMNTEDSPCTDANDLCGPLIRRDLSDQCVWSGPDIPLNSDAAEKHCAILGGDIISIYNQVDRSWLMNNGYFNYLQPWNAYYTGYFQKAGAGAPRFKDGSALEPIDGLWAPPTAYSYGLFAGQPEVMFASSLESTGSSLLYFPYDFDGADPDGQWNLYNDAPWNILNLLFFFISPGVIGHRETKEAFVICESSKADFCYYNSPSVKNADKTNVNKGHFTYTCWDGYSFSNGETNEIFLCDRDCNVTAFKELTDTLEVGCLPIDPCDPNPCDHTCRTSTRDSRIYNCNCYAGYKLAADNVTCEDINECDKEDSDICDMGEASGCRNLIGSYSCFCYTGYGFGRNGKCEASSPYTTGTIQLIYGLPAPCGDTDDETIRQELIDSVYLLIGNPVFNGQVTIRNVQINDINEMIVTLDIGGVVTLREQSVITYRFYQLLRSPGLTAGGSGCSIPDYVYYYADGVPRRIPVTGLCSLYNGLEYCTPDQSECEAENDGPVCECNAGFTGYRCESEVMEPTTAPPPPPVLSTFEVVVVVMLVIFGIIIIVNILIICIICAARSQVRPIPRPPMEPVYGKVPRPFPQALPRPFGRLMPRKGFPIGARF